MTREEAIKVLSGILHLNYRNFWDEECDEAIDMAIEALSADATDVYKAHEEEHLNIANRIKELQYAIAKTQTIVGKMIESADAVQVVRCKDCKSKRLYDEGETKYYYCALEDRPNRNWSVDDTDYCSWGERREP